MSISGSPAAVLGRQRFLVEGVPSASLPVEKWVWVCGAARRRHSGLGSANDVCDSSRHGTVHHAFYSFFCIFCLFVSAAAALQRLFFTSFEQHRVQL